jgi:hypothetical protein
MKGTSQKPAGKASPALIWLPVVIVAWLGVAYWYAPLFPDATPKPKRLPTFGKNGQILKGNEVRTSDPETRIQLAYVEWSDPSSKAIRSMKLFDGLPKAAWRGPGKDRLREALHSLRLDGPGMRIVKIADHPVRPGKGFDFAYAPNTTYSHPGLVKPDRMVRSEYRYDFYELNGIVGMRTKCKEIYWHKGRRVPREIPLTEKGIPVRLTSSGTVSCAERSLEGKAHAVIETYYRPTPDSATLSKGSAPAARS